MSHANVVRFLRDHLGPRAGRAALVTASHRYTYGELAAAVDGWAGALRTASVGRGDRVALLTGTTREAVLAMLAAAKLGAVAVPLNVRWAAPEVGHALDVCTPDVLLTQGRHADLGRRGAAAADHAVRVLDLDALAADADRPGADPLPYADVGFDDPLRVLFTSGTTSRPKGAITTHGNSAWNHHSLVLDGIVAPDDTVLVCYPLFHVSGLEAPGIFGVLAAGATCVLLDSVDVDDVVAAIVGHEVTGAVLLPPTYDDAVARLGTTLGAAPLRWVITGGLDPTIVRAFAERLPGRRLIEVFAMTEATGPMTVLDGARMLEKAGRTGRAVRHLDVEVVDDDGAPAPTGTAGAIRVRGPKISPGYWGVPPPERPGGWFDTGDLGDLDDDGYLAYRGRAKEMIKSGGENVSMAEVERVIVQHPAVQAACLVRLPHPRWQEVPKAYVLPVPGAVVTADELEAHCREHLAGFKVPRVWAFVEDLPYNHSGKVLRRVLQEREDAALTAAGAAT